jgi:hypothetical protein
MFTKEEFLENIATVDENGTVTFRMPFDFDHLVANQYGIDLLNEEVGEFVEDGYMLEDISYNIEGVEGNTIFIHVEAFAPNDFWPKANQNTLTIKEKEEKATLILGKVKELIKQGHIKSDWSNVHALQQVMKEL